MASHPLSNDNSPNTAALTPFNVDVEQSCVQHDNHREIQPADDTIVGHGVPVAHSILDGHQSEEPAVHQPIGAARGLDFTPLAAVAAPFIAAAAHMKVRSIAGEISLILLVVVLLICIMPLVGARIVGSCFMQYATGFLFAVGILFLIFDNQELWVFVTVTGIAVTILVFLLLGKHLKIF